MKSLPCEAACHELDHCNEDVGCCGFDEAFEILGHSPVTPDPGEGAFDHPSAGQNLKAGVVIAAFDDTQFPRSDLVERSFELRSLIAAIGPDELQKGEAFANGLERIGSTVAILY